MHNFGHAGDGKYPSGLVDVNGKLYGLTFDGGVSNDGTVFSITRQGVETVLHSFKGTWDGAHPSATLIDVNGKLCGTLYDYSTSTGRIFSVSTSGVVKVLHTFSAGSYDLAPLLDVDGTLYGDTYRGGVFGRGSIFKLQP